MGLLIMPYPRPILLDSLLTSTSLRQLLECLESHPEAEGALLGYVTTALELPDNGNTEEV